MAVQTEIEKDFPESTKKRLIELESLLAGWQGEKITSARICELTGWKDSLIRHDLWLVKQVVSIHPQSGHSTTADFRGWKNGYRTADLLQTIRSVLHKESQSDSINVCIAGLGRLGAALLDEALFEGSGFAIKAGFDSNVNRVEILRSTFPLYPAGDMNWVIKQERITKAILTVADKDAQSMCDRLVKAGISGIVNMTGRVLKVPEGIKIENVSVITALKMVK